MGDQLQRRIRHRMLGDCLAEWWNRVGLLEDTAGVVDRCGSLAVRRPPRSRLLGETRRLLRLVPVRTRCFHNGDAGRLRICRRARRRTGRWMDRENAADHAK
jgi:hypothetical protein